MDTINFAKNLLSTTENYAKKVEQAYGMSSANRDETVSGFFSGLLTTYRQFWYSETRDALTAVFKQFKLDIHSHFKMREKEGTLNDDFVHDFPVNFDGDEHIFRVEQKFINGSFQVKYDFTDRKSDFVEGDFTTFLKKLSENSDQENLAVFKENYPEYNKNLTVSAKETNAATVFQKLIRSYNTDGIKEPNADVVALRDSKLNPIAYNIEGKFIRFPETEEKYHIAGADKTLTHRSKDGSHVGLTLNKSASLTLDPAFLTIIKEQKLDKIKPQFRIDQSRLIAEDLGIDLQVRIDQTRQLRLIAEEEGEDGDYGLYSVFKIGKEEYKFDPLHFKALASNLDILHSLNIVHRDIKPGNMFFKDGHIYLSDLDTLGKVGTFKEDAGTYTMLPACFRPSEKMDNADRSCSINAYKKDQYTFLLSMMKAFFFQIKPSDGKFYPYQNKQFLQRMPCDASLKKELKNFLKNPEAHVLSLPLANYFNEHNSQDTHYSMDQPGLLPLPLAEEGWEGDALIR